MVEVLLAMGLPTLVFGAFALLSVWLGAESRPWFDERMVLDDRPNWWPTRCSAPPDEDEDEDDDDEPHDGTPAPAPAPPRAQPRPAPLATRAATSPSGV